MNLNELALKHGTDKYREKGHRYTPHYERHFGHLREHPIKFLEIGVGGYDDPNKGGESLRMWKEYFPKATIHGLDIADKTPHNEDRILTIQGDQADRTFLKQLNEQYGPFDIVVDDGSHINSDVIRSFTVLFPLLQPTGVYAVEDLQTSYWPNGAFGMDWEGHDCVPRDHNRLSSINFLKSLVDCTNHAERIDYEPNYFDLHITSLTFYHNLCFVTKGDNNEVSNLVRREIPADKFHAPESQFEDYPWGE